MTDWLVNVKDPDEEKEMGEKRMYIDPEWLEKPKEEKVDHEEFKKKQSEFYDELIAAEKIETKNEEYHLSKRYDDRCVGYHIDAFGKITNVAINTKHSEWDKTITEIMSKIRQYYFYNINTINELTDGSNGNSMMFDNKTFMNYQKISTELNEKLKDLSQTIFTSFNMIFDKLKYEINLCYTGNQEFAKVIGKFMDNLNNVLLDEIYQNMTRLFDGFEFNPGDNKAIENLINKILHFSQVDYYRFRNVERYIDFYRNCYEDKMVLDTINDDDKRVIMIILCREMGIINKELYKFSCYLAETALTPNIRYKTLYVMSNICDNISNNLFINLIEIMKLMIEQIIKGSKYYTQVYEEKLKNLRF